MVRFYDEEKKREFIFLTNNNKLKASKVAFLYKQRWQVELFFKWIKQHLQVKNFWGQSENAVKIQIYVAIITYCIVSIIKDK
jgi:IS4 transposase